MKSIRNLFQTSAAILAVFALGCGGGMGKPPKLVPVTGKVTVGGSEPFKNGTVRFIPKTDQSLNGREAITDESGNFKVMFHNSLAGLEPGDYTVMFSLYQMKDGSPLPDQSNDEDPKSPKELGAVQFVPPQYTAGAFDGSLVTVSEESESFEFDIPELKPQPPGRRR